MAFIKLLWWVKKNFVENPFKYFFFWFVLIKNSNFQSWKMHVDIFQALLPGDCKACALQYLPSVLVSRNIKPTWWRWWWFRTREKEPKCIINQSIYMQLVSSQKNKFQWEAVTFKFTWTQRFLEDDNVKGISLTFCVIWDNLRRRKPCSLIQLLKACHAFF